MVLVLVVLVIGALLAGLAGHGARRVGLRDPVGQAVVLTIIALGLIYLPGLRGPLLIAGDTADRILTLAREIGLAGLFFLAGNQLRFDAFLASTRRCIAVAAGLLLFASVIALLLSYTREVALYPAFVIAACIAASSVWLPGQLLSSDNPKASSAIAVAEGTAVVVSGVLMLVVHLLGALHEVAGLARSTSSYVIVAAYELVKLAVFFSFSWLVASRFLDRASKGGARVGTARQASGYLLIAVLVFALASMLIGPLGPLAWSFIAGTLFSRSEAGRQTMRYRPAAASTFLSFTFLPLFIQPHGRTIGGTPILLLAITGALVIKFAMSALASRSARSSPEDTRMVAAATMASGELGVALLAFALTRWVIEPSEYFAVLFFSLFSFIVAPIAFKLASKRAAERVEPRPPSEGQDRESYPGRIREHSRKYKAALTLAILATPFLTIDGTARAQNIAQTVSDDPVARAMRTVEESINQRAAAAERLLAGSKLVNESKAARKQGKRDLAREAVKKAEGIAADSEFNRSALIDDLLRMVAAERAALDLPARRDVKQSGPTISPELVPSSVRARLEQYRETLTRILEEEQVPAGLLAVALVESGFNPLALSPKGARGIWQFMPATAVRYGLTVEPGNDHRTNPEHSTRAAARYLRSLYNQFGDWKLALAAYNAGEQRIQRVIDRTGIRDFDEMSRRGLLPLETRRYVPAVLAASSRIRGTNSLTTAKAPIKGKSSGGVAETQVKLEDSSPAPQADDKP